MAIIQDWKISSRGTHCSKTEEPFEDGDRFFTCIFDDPESDGFIRKDFSEDSWKVIEPELEAKPFSFWKSTFKVPVVVEKKQVLEKHSAEGMLRKMEEANEPGTENARFILALMLERKKILIPVDVQETDERKLLVYKHKETEEIFIVVDPQLRLDEIESVQEDVADLLAGRKAIGVESPTADDEAEESENTGPETEEEQPADPEAVDPEAVDPEVVDPEVTDPEATDPDEVQQQDSIKENSADNAENAESPA